MDCRKLNDIKKDSFPLLRIHNTLSLLTRAKWFSSVYLKEKCFQVVPHPDNNEENILNWARVVAIHAHSLWPLQLSSSVKWTRLLVMPVLSS
jgi:hypothetical protein